MPQTGTITRVYDTDSNGIGRLSQMSDESGSASDQSQAVVHSGENFNQSLNVKQHPSQNAQFFIKLAREDGKIWALDIKIQFDFSHVYMRLTPAVTGTFVVSPYVSGYLSPQLKLKHLRGEARGYDAKKLFKRI